MPDQPLLLSAEQAGQSLGVKTETIYRWLKTGELDGMNVATNPNGRPRWRISQAEVDRFRTTRTAKVHSSIQR
jgi:excisionase family DNA binding protein